MEDIIKFGESPAEDEYVISATVNLGPFFSNRGTSQNPDLEELTDVEVDMDSLVQEINNTVWDESRHRVVFFDDLEDCANYYKNNMSYYPTQEPVRVAGVIKEIDLAYKTAKIQINPHSIFREPSSRSSRYILYIRGLTEWKDKIYYTRIYSYDLVLVEGGNDE